MAMLVRTVSRYSEPIIRQPMPRRASAAPHFAIASLTGDVDLEEAFGAPTVCFTLLAL